MLIKLYAVFDEKAGAYMQPFFALQNGQALRMFGDLVGDGKSSVNLHPEDYSLYELGIFDDNSGEVISPDKPNYLARGLDFTGMKEN